MTSSELKDRGLREHMSTLMWSQGAKVGVCVCGVGQGWSDVADEAKEASS